MKGGTKPRPGTRRAEKFQDGAKKSGGVNTQRHAGPRAPARKGQAGLRGHSWKGAFALEGSPIT